MEGLTPDDLAGMIKPRPKRLARDETIIESERELISNEVKELELQGNLVKLRIYVEEITTKKRVVTIREFNPDLSYEDSIESFVQK